MTSRRLALLSLPIAIALTGASASAQTPADAWDKCRGDSDRTVIEGCTRVLQSRQLDEPEMSEALSARATAYRHLRDYPHAIADYEEAVRLRPGAVWAHAGLALSHRESGNTQRAIGEFDIALRLAETELGGAGPQSAEYAHRASRIGLVLLERGLAYEQQHDGEHAIADYREGMSRAPHEPDLGNALCWILATRGESLDEARRACDQSLRDRPDHPPTLDSRGLVNLKQQRFQDAWNDYDAAARLGPDGPSWVFGRGVAALRLGRTAEGQADIARAERLNAGVRQYYADLGIRP